MGTTVNLFFWAALENVSEASTCMLQSFAPSEPKMAAVSTPMARKRGFSPSEAALEAGCDEFTRGAAAPPARLPAPPNVEDTPTLPTERTSFFWPA